ncbi:hypothetical protein Dimus_011581 [Dionaea muscipula]
MTLHHEYRAREPFVRITSSRIIKRSHDPEEEQPPSEDEAPHMGDKISDTINGIGTSEDFGRNQIDCNPDTELDNLRMVVACPYPSTGNHPSASGRNLGIGVDFHHRGSEEARGLRAQFLQDSANRPEDGSVHFGPGGPTELRKTIEKDIDETIGWVGSERTRNSHWAHAPSTKETPFGRSSTPTGSRLRWLRINIPCPLNRIRHIIPMRSSLFRIPITSPPSLKKTIDPSMARFLHPETRRTSQEKSYCSRSHCWRLLKQLRPTPTSDFGDEGRESRGRLSSPRFGKKLGLASDSPDSVVV